MPESRVGTPVHIAHSVKSFLVGVLCGILVSYLAVYSIAMTAAIAMPRDFPVVLWQVAVVFGLGAFAPALIIYSAGLLLLRPNMLVSLTGLFIAVIVGLSIIAGLTFAGSALAAMILGALAATLFASLWPRRSLKSNPLNRPG